MNGHISITRGKTLNGPLIVIRPTVVIIIISIMFIDKKLCRMKSYLFLVQFLAKHFYI